MSLIEGVLARVWVESIDDALPLYEALAESPDTRRFSFGDVDLALVGPFLLLQGDPHARQRFGDRVASLIVSDMQAAEAAVHANGGQITEGPGEGPNGLRMIARHADGAVFEYLTVR